MSFIGRWSGNRIIVLCFLDRWEERKFCFQNVEVTAYEIDRNLQNHLRQHLSSYPHVHAHIVEGDYIIQSINNPRGKDGYTHVILNPPYKKSMSVPNTV